MSLLRYTALRLLVLAVVGALLWASGLRGLLLVAVAFVLSGLVSLVLLRKARDKVSVDISDRVERRGPRQSLAERVNARIDAANRAEDDAVDGVTPEADGDREPSGDEGDEPGRPASR